MWDGYRRWRHTIVPVLITVALALMKLNAEDSASWRAGVVLAVAMGLTYVIEEIVWNLKSGGRPCSNW
jgi:heme/copper-type cytochrome/quinol oxidase subunit 3